MNKRMVFGIAVLLITSGISTACSTSKKDEMMNHSSMVKTATASQEQKTDAKTVPNALAKPTLDAQIKQDSKSATITFEVKNLQISAEHYGKQSVPGEGHLHLSVDGVQKAMLKTNAPVKLDNLSIGKHTIKLELQQNDHTPLNVEKVFQIEVK